MKPYNLELRKGIYEELRIQFPLEIDISFLTFELIVRNKENELIIAANTSKHDNNYVYFEFDVAESSLLHTGEYKYAMTSIFEGKATVWTYGKFYVKERDDL